MAPEVRLGPSWLLVFLGHLVRLISSTTLSQTTPCAYPVYIERNACGVHDSYILDGLFFFCDPDSTVSMSEMQLVDENLQRVYQKHQTKCVCSGKHTSAQCWYKFGFAFLRELLPIEGVVTEGLSGEHCALNRTLLTHQMPSITWAMDPPSLLNYGENYARVVRERWNMGDCGEDLLILVVQRRPTGLVPHEFGNDGRPPMLFLSYGSLVAEKVISLESPYLQHSGRDAGNQNPLERIVAEANDGFMRGYSMNLVLNNFIIHISEALTKAEHHYGMPLHKDHIPFWAWMVFATCGVLCIFMGIGLCWIRSTTRRGSQRGKMISDPNRRWKAGFAGDDSAPSTNVNLVQMLFPRGGGGGTNI